MKNNKGFTLVELLAMLVVLGVLIGISVPNITGILNQQKENAYIDDATKVINTAQMKLSTERKIKRPADGNCIVFSLNYLDKASELKKSATGGEYIRKESYVIVRRNGQKIEYTIRLIEKTATGDVYGIEGATLQDLANAGTANLGDTDVDGIDIETATSESLETIEPFVSMCSAIEAVYN